MNLIKTMELLLDYNVFSSTTEAWPGQMGNYLISREIGEQKFTLYLFFDHLQCPNKALKLVLYNLTLESLENDISLSTG